MYSIKNMTGVNGNGRITAEDFDLDQADIFLATPREKFKTIRAKYNTICMWCGGVIEYGEPMQWAPGASCAHPDCFEESHGHGQSRAG